MEYNFISKRFHHSLIHKIEENNILYKKIFKSNIDKFIEFKKERDKKREHQEKKERKRDYKQEIIKCVYISLIKPVFMFRTNQYHVMCTRFDNESWYEWQRYHERKMLKDKYIYNVPVEINETILLHSCLFVFEMNNSTNEIMGISFLKNKTNYKKKYNIYKDGNYNRFHYITRKRFSREYIKNMNQGIFSLLHCIEFCLFKGKEHAKRGHGISYIPLITFQKYYKVFVSFIYYLFVYNK